MDSIFKIIHFTFLKGFCSLNHIQALNVYYSWDSLECYYPWDNPIKRKSDQWAYPICGYNFQDVQYLILQPMKPERSLVFV